MTSGKRVTRAAVLLALATAAILCAGLMPFEFNPRNDVGFLSGEPGWRFEGRGFAVSRRSFAWRSHETGFGLELLLRCRDIDDPSLRSIVTLDDGQTAWPLEVLQEGRDLLIKDRVINPDGERWSHSSRFSDVLRAGVVQHIAISSGPRGPLVFVDARPSKKDQGYAIPTIRPEEPFGGHLFLGATSLVSEPWAGDVLGLAMYGRALGLDEVVRHRDMVSSTSMRSLEREAGLVALYPLDGGAGDRAANLAAADNPLELPAHFLPFRRVALAPPSFEHWSESWYILDFIVNVLGFLPWGVAFSLLLCRRSHLRRSTVFLCTIAGSACLSLLIEWAQHYALTRDSSLQDVILNTLGALVGSVIVCARDPVRVLRAAS